MTDSTQGVCCLLLKRVKRVVLIFTVIIRVHTHTHTLAQDIHTIAHTLNQSAMQRLQGHLSTFPTLIFPKCLKAFFSGPHIKTEQSYGYFGSTSGWYISTYRKTSISQFISFFFCSCFGKRKLWLWRFKPLQTSTKQFLFISPLFL